MISCEPGVHAAELRVCANALENAETWKTHT